MLVARAAYTVRPTAHLLVCDRRGCVVDRTIESGIPTARPRVGAEYRAPVRAAKRGFDIVGSAVLILLLIPVALLVTLAVVIDSRGPVFFRQRRMGQGGAEFSLIKFRTMVRDADAVLTAHLASDADLRREWGETQKLREDPRVTRLGGLIRRFSLDELPQLLNVFIGNMSLVGPRPVLRNELARFGERAAGILEVRPGLTGLWAVSGRNDISYEDRAQLEYRYATEWTLRMDAMILLKTIPAVVRGHGAY
jgi:exopolysaccharide production protein ExoY